MRKLVVTVLVVLVVLIVGDRVADSVSEAAVAQTMQSSEHLKSEPSVDIAGFPFLTQLVSRDLDQVTITAKGVPLGNNGVHVTLSRVTAVMRNVKIALNLHSVTIGHGDATALLSYADLSKTLSPLQLSYGGNNDVKASAQVLGHTFSFDLSPNLAGKTLQFAYQNLPRAAQVLADVLGTRIPLDKIPFHLKLKSLDAQPNGVVVRLSGDNVTFKRH